MPPPAPVNPITRPTTTPMMAAIMVLSEINDAPGLVVS
jgi:hypothetical protein